LPDCIRAMSDLLPSTRPVDPTMRCSLFMILAFLALCLSTTASVDTARVATAGSAEERDPRVDNLIALARLYNAVRFFHPSDEAAETEWGGLMMYAAARVTYAESPGELRRALLEVFEPLAPTLAVTDSSTPAGAAQEAQAEGPHIHWRHLGLECGERPNAYRSLRVRTDEPDTPDEIRVHPGERTVVELGRGLVAAVPLTLAVSEAGVTLPAADPGRLARLRAAVDGMQVDLASGDDLYARTATICMVWAALESFFPYFDEVDVDWGREFERALSEALKPQGRDAFVHVVSRFVERLEDGHGIIGYRYDQRPCQPTARFERLRDGRIVVTRVWEETAFEVGDIVLRVDGRSAEEELVRWKAVTPGSAQLQEHRALNRFLSGPKGSTAEVSVRRGERELILAAERTEANNMFFRKATFEHPMVEELEPGTWYVNLSKLDANGYQEHEPRLRVAERLVIDYRWGGSRSGDFGMDDLVRRLVPRPMPSPTWQLPLVTRPDRDRWTWFESSWSYSPQGNPLGADVAVLTNAPVVSFGETLLSFFRQYGLGILVGSASAGCNGNANTLVDLPAKISVTFTGMKVEKHDGSTLYGIGYEPDVAVVPTLEGIRAGRDEVREAAVQALKG
ncbi:MAG: S41 family peptidase, partial [Planctomycetota bacterium]